MFNEIDHMVADFNRIRREFDPWFEYTDDIVVYIRHCQNYLDLRRIRNDLGLFGQDLTIPYACKYTQELVYR